MRRRAVNKRKSARKFNKGAKKIHARNMVMRGGYRL